jgi:uncharacterized membrane protein
MTTLMRSPVLVVGVIIGLALGAAALVGSGEAWTAIVSGGIPIAYAAVVTVVGRRSDSLSVLSGRPIDERAEHVNQEASTWGFGITALGVVAAVAWQTATDGDWAPYAAIAVVMAFAYLGSLLLLHARH